MPVSGRMASHSAQMRTAVKGAQHGPLGLVEAFVEAAPELASFLPRNDIFPTVPGSKAVTAISNSSLQSESPRPTGFQEGGESL